jgi:hypothetical protein
VWEVERFTDTHFLRRRKEAGGGETVRRGQGPNSGLDGQGELPSVAAITFDVGEKWVSWIPIHLDSTRKLILPMNEQRKILGAVLMVMACTLNVWAEEFMVDLNRPNTYAAVFESGLHPRYTIEGETSTVEVRPDTAVGFKLLDWNIPPVKAVWAFNVGKDKTLSSIRGIVSDAWTKNDVYKFVAPLELALGGDASTLAKMEAWIDGYPDSSINGDTWGRKVFSQDKRISAAYYFRHSMQSGNPLSLTVSIEFHRSLKDSGFHEGILKPPPGFEHVDISKVWPDSGDSSVPSRDALVANEQPSPVRISLDSPVSHRPRWWWVLVLVVLAIVVGVMWRRSHGEAQ